MNSGIGLRFLQGRDEFLNRKAVVDHSFAPTVEKEKGRCSSPEDSFVDRGIPAIVADDQIFIDSETGEHPARFRAIDQMQIGIRVPLISSFIEFNQVFGSPCNRVSMMKNDPPSEKRKTIPNMNND